MWNSRWDKLVTYRHLHVLVVATSVMTFVIRGDNVSTTSPRVNTPDVESTSNLDFHIEDILDTYQGQSTRPSENSGHPDYVWCALPAINIDGIDQVNMEFTIAVSLELQWEDYRLQDLLPADSNTIYSIRGTNIDKIWLPDLYFPLLKSGDFHEVTTKNRIVRVQRDYGVFYASRLTLTQSCMMDLAFFPFDAQRCDTHISTLAYSDNELQLFWRDENPNWSVALNVPQFHLSYDQPVPQLSNFSVRTEYKVNATETFHIDFSALNISIYLQRKSAYYLLTQMTSSILLTTLSWLNYWLDPEQTAARISLGITTVLAAVTQVSNAHRGLPRLPYNTALDIWLSVCLNATITGLCEYAVVHMLVFRAKRQEDRLQRLQATRQCASTPTRAETSFAHPKTETLGFTLNGTQATTANSAGPSDAQVRRLRDSAMRCRRWARRIDLSMRILMPMFLASFIFCYLVLYGIVTV